MTNNKGGKGARWRRNFRRGNVAYGAEAPAPLIETSGGMCSKRFTGAGYACHCGVYWDQGEDRPPCPHQGSY